MRDVPEHVKFHARVIRWGVPPLLIVAMALWLEALVTMAWTYADCDFPVFGWPLPNRAYSECCSLEWLVDWPAYFIDLSVYILISTALYLVARFSYRTGTKIAALPFGLALFTSPLIFIGMSMWYSGLPVLIENLRPAGFGFHTGYGSCKA